MILLTYDQRERLINASSKSKHMPKEKLDEVIEDLIIRSPYAFTQKTVNDLKRKHHMRNFKGYANID